MSGIVVNPTDYFSLLILPGTGSGVYTVPFGFTVTDAGSITVLGIPLVWSNAIASGQYLVGDFSNGAALWQRQGLTLQVFNQDSDNVQRNMLTIRVEERIALTVFDKTAFIYPT